MNNNSSIEALINDLTCDDVLKCQKARRELVAMGSPAVGPLVEALSSRKYWVRWESAKALGQIGDAAAAKALVEALEDEEFDIQWLGAEGLINIGRDALVPLLEALADHGDKSLFLRRGAHHVLHDMNRGAADEILQPVMRAVDDAAPAAEILQVAPKAMAALEGR